MGPMVTGYGRPMHITDFIVFVQIFASLVTDCGVVDLKRLPVMGSLWKRNLQ